MLKAAGKVLEHTCFVVAGVARNDLPLVRLDVDVRHHSAPVDINAILGLKLGGDRVEVPVDERKHLDVVDGRVLGLDLGVVLEEVVGEADLGSRHIEIVRLWGGV